MDKLLSHIRKSLINRKATEVGEVICDGIRIKEITKEAKEEMEKYVNVNLLCLNDCQLETLSNLPLLLLLEEIQLSDNSLNGEDISKLCIYPHLTIVKLCNNKINTIEDLKPFKKLNEVIYLDLSDCPVTKCDNYRTKVFDMIPHLKHLDAVDRKGNNCSEIDVKSIQEEEEFMKTIKEQKQEETDNDNDEIEEEELTDNNEDNCETSKEEEDEDDNDDSRKEKDEHTISDEVEINKIIKRRKDK